MDSVLSTVDVDEYEDELVEDERDLFELDVERAEQARRDANRQVAWMWAAVADALEWPERATWVFVSQDRPDGVELARRAATLEVSRRMAMSKHRVTAIWKHTMALRTHLPLTWAEFGRGGLSERKAMIAAEVSYTLPEGAHGEFDAALAGLGGLTDRKFEKSAARLRERLHPRPMEERHAEAMDHRDVEVVPEPDGMATLMITHSADAIARAQAQIDARAWQLCRQPDEGRTMPQLRADVAVVLLMGKGAGTATRADIALVVPVLTLLDRDDEPATLQGGIPVDKETAKRLVGEAASFTRILTDPIDGTVLDIDEKTRRIPAAIKRWLGVLHETCTGPGCNRPFGLCDIDHTIEFASGPEGRTSLANLAPLCRPDHRVKGETNWRVEQTGDGRLRWISPTGYVTHSDPLSRSSSPPPPAPDPPEQCPF